MSKTKKHKCFDPPINKLNPSTTYPKKSGRCWICGRSTTSQSLKLKEKIICCDADRSSEATSMHTECLEEVLASTQDFGHPKNGSYNCKYFLECHSQASKSLPAFVCSVDPDYVAKTRLQIEDDEIDPVEIEEFNLKKLDWFNSPIEKLKHIKTQLQQTRNEINYKMFRETLFVREIFRFFFKIIFQHIFPLHGTSQRQTFYRISTIH